MITTGISLLGTVVALLDIFATFSVLLGSSSSLSKIMWIAIILLLSLIGMGLYFLIGRSTADAHA